MRLPAFLLALSLFMVAHGQPKRPLRPADIYRLGSIAGPQISPDGQWVSYTLTTVDSLKDKRSSSLWMIRWDGTEDIRLTHDGEGERNARWSPDGKWISFLSARQDAKGNQIWLLDRRGGEARRLTDFKTGVNDYSWSPDAKKILVTLTDPEQEDSSKIKTPKPYVIDRFKYKADVEGYLYKKLHTHLYLFDPITQKLDTLTRGVYDEGDASWSPDGTHIVFVSNRTPDPDQNENSDLFVMEAKPGASSKQLTTWTGADDHPRFSPDGQWIAYTRSTGNGDFIMYDQPVLCVIAAQGGEPRLLTLSLDRPVSNPRWSADGNELYCTVEDDRQQYLAAFSPANGQMKKIRDGERSIYSVEGASGKWVFLESNPQLPAELFVLDGGQARQLTHKQDSFLLPLALAKVEGFESTSSDGTRVSGLLYRPATVPPDQKLPLLLYIHGGPVGQDDYGFDLTRQMLAGAGYLVAAVNYRGSNGRGLDYCKSIFADWGKREVIDLQGAVDYLVKKGWADARKLGVGGWSYGGILTDYLIASDTRFKAACSGAGTGFTLSLYGVDQYVTQYTHEIGVPWKHMDTYIKISYPLLKADRIKTPTLFLSGEKDFNVPTAGSEQMYEALRTLGIPTELIIYPSQFHGITAPSYQRDRLERYLAWYAKYLHP